MNNFADITIIGAGPSGLFAAFMAGMLEMSSNIIDIFDEVGGQCSALYPEKYIYDIPGHYKIKSQDFISNLKMQANRFNTKYYLSQSVIDISKNNNTWSTKTSCGNCIHSSAIILATGAGAFSPKKPPIKDIENFEGSSLFYNIKNIQNFFDKTIMIAGGGDSALDWTVELSNIAKKIYLIHRRENFTGNAIVVKEILELNSKGIVEIIKPYQIHGIYGSNKQISHVEIKNIAHQLKTIEIERLLLFFGMEQNNTITKNWSIQPSQNKNGFIVNQSTCATDISGIFAIGDAATYNNKIKLILSSFGEAASACNAAYILIKNKPPKNQHSTSKIKETI